MKHFLVFFFSIVIFSINSQGGKLIDVIPNMEFIRRSVDSINKLNLIDSNVTVKLSLDSKIIFLNHNNITSVSFLYQDQSIREWDEKRRNGVFIYKGWVTVKYFLRRQRSIKKLVINSEGSDEKIVIISKRNKLIFRHVLEYWVNRDVETYTDIFHSFSKEIPLVLTK